MESALSDLKKICDEVKDTLDPVILSSIESLIDKTYNALSDENEDARHLLEETLMRGVELVQKSKIGQASMGLNSQDDELVIDDDTTEEEEESESEIIDEEERCDSSATTDDYDEGPIPIDATNVGTSITIGDNEVRVQISQDGLGGQVGQEHSYSVQAAPGPIIRLKVDPPTSSSDSACPLSNPRHSSNSLERMEESSKVITHTKVRKVLKSVNSTNPFVHRVSTATSTGLPKYMFTPRTGQIKSGVYKASTTTAIKPNHTMTKQGNKLNTSQTTTIQTSESQVTQPQSPPSKPSQPPQKTDASTGTEPSGLISPDTPMTTPIVDPPNTVVTKYTHQWTLAHFSKKMKMGVGKSIDSMFFSIIVQGKKTDWSLMLYPNGDKDKVSGYVSLYLTCRNRKGLSMSLEFKFTILDQAGKNATAPTKSGSITAQMLATNSSWGWESFVKQDELSSHNLLPNDRLTIMCDITLKCCDLEQKPSMKQIAVDNRDIDQLVDFVGEIEIEGIPTKGKKKSKKPKNKKNTKGDVVTESCIYQEVEAATETVMAIRNEDELVNQQLSPTPAAHKEVAETPTGETNNAKDFQVVTRRKARKNSEKSNISSKTESPQGKPRGTSKKTTPPRPARSKSDITPKAPHDPVQTPEVEIISSNSTSPNTPVQIEKPNDGPLNLTSLRIDTKESLEALLSTKSLLEENINRLTELVENKSNTVSNIAMDKVNKLKDISAAQDNLKEKKIKLESRRVETERMLSQIQIESEDVDHQLRRAGEKAARLTMYLDMNLSDAESELRRLGEEKKNLSDRLVMVEDKLRGNRQKERLLNIHNQIRRLQTNLECPICLDTAANPIFQCREGHLICSSCVAKVAQCAMCRQEGAVSIRNRYAEKDSLELSKLLEERKDIMKALTGE